jgi:aromatic-ring opening dioxygenase LigAB LigA subunit
MSAYTLQKMIREVNRRPDRREAYFASRENFVQGYDVTPEERAAFVAFDIGKLYALGVHGLILRPFSLLHKVPEPEYLAAIRKDP